MIKRGDESFAEKTEMRGSERRRRKGRRMRLEERQRGRRARLFHFHISKSFNMRMSRHFIASKGGKRRQTAPEASHDQDGARHKAEQRDRLSLRTVAAGVREYVMFFDCLCLCVCVLIR